MRLTILGSGDAFGSGGRLPSCYLVENDDFCFMLDCGPSVLPALKQKELTSSDFSKVFISHLHGDHIGGLPFLLLDMIFVSCRTEPLTLIGPPGLEARFRLACEIFYPRSLGFERGFQLSFVELDKGVRYEMEHVSVTAFQVEHFSGSPSYAFRFELEDKIFAFSGDSGWTESIVEAGRNADLYLMECNQYNLELPMHLDYLTIARNFEKIGARKFLLTHMGDQMLAKIAEVDKTRCLVADDGMCIDF